MKSVDYSDLSSVVDALKGQDALVITLGGRVDPAVQNTLIDAAIQANVSWILPNEWGSDTAHPEIKKFFFQGSKTSYRERIEKSGTSSFIAVVSNQWYDFTLGLGNYFIDIKNRTATILDSGDVKTVTTTMPQVGRAVASLLSLPVTGASPCVNDWKNKHLYIESFFLTQKEMLAAVQRATGTDDGDWKIERESAEKLVTEGEAQLNRGEFTMTAFRNTLMGMNFWAGHGNDYVASKGTANEILKLPKENLDEITRDCVERTLAGEKWI